MEHRVKHEGKLNKEADSRKETNTEVRVSHQTETVGSAVNTRDQQRREERTHLEKLRKLND